jgi:(p)ppGpp synthase/HD superfamily hydrolase
MKYEFDIENYKRTLEFATKAHGKQETPTGFPYVVHLTSVATEVLGSFMNGYKSFDINLSINCALLHDTIEDTLTTYENINEYFGKTVADGVMALTKNKNFITKQEQMEDSIKRLIEQPIEVQLVKLADRITNLSSTPSNWNEKKKNKYLNESNIIYNNLKNSNEYLSKRLKNKIDNYLIQNVEIINEPTI